MCFSKSYFIFSVNSTTAHFSNVRKVKPMTFHFSPILWKIISCWILQNILLERSERPGFFKVGKQNTTVPLVNQHGLWSKLSMKRETGLLFHLTRISRSSQLMDQNIWFIGEMPLSIFLHFQMNFLYYLLTVEIFKNFFFIFIWLPTSY